MSGVFNTLLGGKSQGAPAAYGQMSPDEINRLQDVESNIRGLTNQANNQREGSTQDSSAITNLFQQHLKDFLTQGPNPTPDQINQASQFVDQTFTNPAQQQFKTQLQDLQSNYNANAASLGRNPGSDIASQQAFAAQAQRGAQSLQSERGNRIQQATNDMYNRGLSSLNAGMQGSGFLNNLTQQAFQNQMGLLNSRTGLADYYQKNRANLNQQPQQSSGLLGNVGSILGQASNIGASAYKIGNSVSNALGGIGGQSAGPTNEYRSSNS